MSVEAADLLARTRAAFSLADGHDAGPLRELLGMLEGEFGAMASRPPSAEDAETCRLAMLAAVGAGDHAGADVWRARSLSRAAAVGWTAAIGSFVMGEALRRLARDNDDYPLGRTLDVIRPSTAALSIVGELELFLGAPDLEPSLGSTAPNSALLERFMYEKGGFLLLVAGNLAGARSNYVRALEVAAGTRGEIKVQLGIALVDYLEAKETGSDATASRDATLQLGQQASAAGINDLASTAARNAAVMDTGGRALEPYEIL